MKSSSTHIPPEILRSMQYMSERNGGLLVDFKPLRRYAEIAPGEQCSYLRVRTLLDWIALAAEVGLLTRENWPLAFACADDIEHFCAELRYYDAPMEKLHQREFERLGIIRAGAPPDYAHLARCIEAALPRRAPAALAPKRAARGSHDQDLYRSHAGTDA
ncbi:MAG: hypothetical protein HYY28_07820 [Betaproteobacteria bacterium]|nr:hypothetical protein [Betaproteobacteria bacterium]